MINSIAFFSTEHQKITRKPLYKTTLLKYLALFYYKVFSESGEPPLELSFIAMENGPVAEEVYVGINENAFNVAEFEIIKSTTSNDSEQIQILGKSYNLDFFSEFEIEIMNELIQNFATMYKNNTAIIDATHELRPWKIAWENRGKSRLKKMNDEDIFDESFQNTLASEHYAIYKNLRDISGAHFSR
ncbi:type II toxin-antitoxin system antitoxin SocA domain-containing protein [Leptospira ilyithenensis]|uniref:type II toxin-antitoxin system antitoxin SocA domain-containing protein n=1 Tax=Leptospira ilyithenensis TaxID=2484901 RepID=UPI001AEF93FE|nr:Panacea domain-containing protein [Leptospira ilyithenensis]